MRYFYLSFSIWNAVRAELTWTHYRLVMRIKEKHIRDFYIEEYIKSNWSTRELERVINEEKRLIEEYKLLKNNENRIHEA